jgi:hypothetical protein
MMAALSDGATGMTSGGRISASSRQATKQTIKPAVNDKNIRFISIFLF